MARATLNILLLWLSGATCNRKGDKSAVKEEIIIAGMNTIGGRGVNSDSYIAQDYYVGTARAVKMKNVGTTYIIKNRAMSADLRTRVRRNKKKKTIIISLRRYTHARVLRLHTVRSIRVEILLSPSLHYILYIVHAFCINIYRHDTAMGSYTSESYPRKNDRRLTVSVGQRYRNVLRCSLSLSPFLS